MALSNQQLANGRKSTSLLAAILAANAAATTPETVAASVTILPGDKNVKVTGTVHVGSVDYPVADSNGKVKVYTDIDQFVRFLASTKAVPNSGAVPVTVTNPQALMPAEVIGGDVQARFKRQKASFEKANIVAERELAERTQTEADYVADGYETGSAAAQNALAEVRAQKLSLADAKAYNDAEIARLAALITL